ncbi:hypothetical protein O3M35_012638 [Rhynocoris fuscipes]|uniref:Uncharacterized protein n=1 Tax=Rhynocoris fuscipes TaxID=488301 RepID=A0AAW1D0E2_9HEMI
MNHAVRWIFRLKDILSNEMTVKDYSETKEQSWKEIDPANARIVRLLMEIWLCSPSSGQLRWKPYSQTIRRAKNGNARNNEKTSY